MLLLQIKRIQAKSEEKSKESGDDGEGSRKVLERSQTRKARGDSRRLWKGIPSTIPADIRLCSDEIIIRPLFGGQGQAQCGGFGKQPFAIEGSRGFVILVVGSAVLVGSAGVHLEIPHRLSAGCAISCIP